MTMGPTNFIRIDEGGFDGEELPAELREVTKEEMDGTNDYDPTIDPAGGLADKDGVVRDPMDEEYLRDEVFRRRDCPGYDDYEE